jgi:hypothetical protein
VGRLVNRRLTDRRTLRRRLGDLVIIASVVLGLGAGVYGALVARDARGDLRDYVDAHLVENERDAYVGCALGNARTRPARVIALTLRRLVDEVLDGVPPERVPPAFANAPQNLTVAIKRLQPVPCAKRYPRGRVEFLRERGRAA